MSSPAPKSAVENAEKDEEDVFEPLFDYSRVQPSLPDDDGWYLDESDDAVQTVELGPILESKQKKRSRSYDKLELLKEFLPNIDTKEAEEEEWLPPPPKSIKVMQISTDGNSVLSELRLKTEELMSLTAASAENMLLELEESARKEFQKSAEPTVGIQGYDAMKSSGTGKKIIITVQSKEGGKQFRINVDDKCEKLFKSYAEHVNGQSENFVFCFDGVQISPNRTPRDLDLVDEDIIEVYSKTR